MQLGKMTQANALSRDAEWIWCFFQLWPIDNRSLPIYNLQSNQTSTDPDAACYLQSN